MANGAPRDGSSLCLSCGLCCTGAVFDAVQLRDDEIATARRHRLPLIDRHTHTSFSLPCPQHRGGACGIYVERPHACRAFECTTLAALESGDIDMPEAARRVARAKEMADRVLAALPSSFATEGVWSAAARLATEGERAPDTAAWRARHAAVLLDIGELKAILRKHFRR